MIRASSRCVGRLCRTWRWGAIAVLAVAGPAEASARFELKSKAFDDGGTIPVRFSCDGAGLSPPLAWTSPPRATRSFALLVDDPDAPSGVFRHWAVFNLAPATRELGEGAGAPGGLPQQAANDFGRSGYGGPCPPRGRGAHRYRFRIVALDTNRIDPGPRPRAVDVEQAVSGHILETALLTARFGRR